MHQASPALQQRKTYLLSKSTSLSDTMPLPSIHARGSPCPSSVAAHPLSFMLILLPDQLPAMSPAQYLSIGKKQSGQDLSEMFALVSWKRFPLTHLRSGSAEWCAPPSMMAHPGAASIMAP